MRRLVVAAPQVLNWQTFGLPALQPGEVRLRTHLSAISVSSELSVLAGLPDWSYPTKLGYQTLAVVEAVGEGVTLKPGQRVVSTLGHASHGNVQAKRLIPVPDSASDPVALLCILGEETHKGIRKLGLHPNEPVLVAGAGLLGLLCVFNLTRRGFSQVTVLEPDPHRRQLARTFGATAFAPGKLPYDQFAAALECSASPAGFAELLRHLRPAGRCCVLSDGNWGALTLPPEFHSRELRVVASSDGDDYHAYAQWLWQHADPRLKTLFERSVNPDELMETFMSLRDFPRPVSVLVNWENQPYPASRSFQLDRSIRV